jgi:SIR2-like domain
MPGALDDIGWEAMIRAIGRQRVTPFIGAGMSPHPKAAEIARDWAKEYNYSEITDPTDLARVAQRLAIEVDRMWPKHLLVKRFSTTPVPDFKDPYEPHSLLADLPCEMYVTTNYDSFMSDALRFHKRDPQRLTCGWNDSVANSAAPEHPTVASPWVFHLHGTDTDLRSMVLTEDDYIDFLAHSRGNREMLPHPVLASLSHTMLLFMGYSLTDWTFRVLFRSIEPSISSGRWHVAVQLHPSKSEERYLSERLARMNVRIFWGDAKDFVAELRQRWEAYHAEQAAN